MKIKRTLFSLRNLCCCTAAACKVSMKRNRGIRISISVMVFIFLLTSCNGSISSKPVNVTEGPNESIELIVSAAASMKDVMGKIKTLYEEQYPNVKIVYNFASSGSLQQQIEQGAPVDVFISASKGKMDALQEKALILEDTRIDLLENNIVLVAPKDSAEEIKDFDDLATNKVKKFAMGEPNSVPAGKYALETLTSLKLMDTLKDKTVQGKDVREVLSWVATGNVEAGIVYETDAIITEEVNIVTVAPADSHSPVVYPAAIIKDSKHQDAAKVFLDFLLIEDAKITFESYGFHRVE